MKLASLVLLSYLIGFLYLMLIRKYDIYEKEPVGKLILFSFIGGLVSVSVASLLYLYIHPAENLFDAIFLVGTVEESAKLITFFLLYKLIKKDFDEIVDGIIYIAAISLGFSVVENLFYALESDYPYKILLIRFLTATIGHITFSVYMGIALYIHKKIHPNYTGLILAFILSTLAHGFYDGFIFEPQLNIFFIPLLIMLIIFGFKLLRLAYAYSKMKNRFNIDEFNLKGRRDYSCCNCGGSESLQYEFGQQDLLLCKQCDHIIIDEKAFKNLLKYYRPVFDRKKFVKTHFKAGTHYLDDEKAIFYHSEKGKINSSIDRLQKWFSIQNQKDLENYHKKYTGKIFYYLGFRFL